MATINATGPSSSSTDECATSVTIDDSQTENKFAKKIAVLGSGMYGRALMERLTSTKRYHVANGARRPVAGQVTQEEAVRNASVVFLAIPVSAHADVIAAIQGSLQRNAILVDISNHPLSSKFREDAVSNAEALQKISPPGVAVVKAFNNISSYDLDGGGTGARVSKRMPVVHMASDDDEALDKMTAIVSAMGMVPVAHGHLASARELEALPHRLFPTWRSSLIVGGVVFAWWLL